MLRQTIIDCPACQTDTRIHNETLTPRHQVLKFSFAPLIQKVVFKLPPPTSKYVKKKLVGQVVIATHLYVTFHTQTWGCKILQLYLKIIIFRAESTKTSLLNWCIVGSMFIGDGKFVAFCGYKSKCFFNKNSCDSLRTFGR